MSGPKRNPDKLNSIGIVVVGICGAVLVYVSIVALQAFYMNDTSEVQTMADYGGQETTFLSLRSQQMSSLKTYRPNAAPVPAAGATPPQTYAIPIDQAIRLVVQGAKTDPSNLVPAIGPAVKPTVKEIYGRPVLLPAPGAGSGSAPAPAGEPGAGSAAEPASPAPADASAGSAAPMTPTAGQAQGGGAPPGTEGQPVKDAGGASPTPKAPADSPKAPPPAPAPKAPAPAPKKGNAS